MSTAPAYPLQMEAALDAPSRWLWLVKWILVIPHLVVLAFLWMAFFVLSVVAFFAILITGRYPRGIFDFNVGVMRWSWRVSYYANGAFATDRYPPFSLREIEDYPTHLAIEYPERLSRGLVLIKWWLLALPHYVIVALLVGGTFFAFRDDTFRVGFSGLIGVLALIGAVVLLFTGRYPQPLFDLVLGLNRWVLRVGAYSALMTDVYPPFRLDAGGSENGETLQVSPPTAPTDPSTVAVRPSGWTGGRVVALVIGAFLALASVPAIGGGIAGTIADRIARDPTGFLNVLDEPFETSGYAIATDGAEVVYDDDMPVVVFDEIIGDVRVRAEATDPAKRTFLGVAAASDIEGYLGGVSRARVTNFGGDSRARTVLGGSPSTPPADQDFWLDSSVGMGELAVTIPQETGSWAIVVMNADGSRGIDITADIGATLPSLGSFAIAAMAIGAVMLTMGVALLVAAVRRAA